MAEDQRKIRFRGVVRSVQVRSDVWRYRLDNRTHSHKGYNVFVEGVADGEQRAFSVAISEKQQQKVHLRIGDELSGTAWTKLHPKWEYADYYRAGALKVLARGPEPDEGTRAPWTSEVEPLASVRFAATLTLGYFVVMSTSAFLPEETMIFGLENVFASSVASSARRVSDISEKFSVPLK